MLPMPSTMSDFQLTIGSIFEHGVKRACESEVLTWMGDHARRSTFREVGNRVRRLAAALQRLGIRPAIVSAPSAGTHRSIWKPTTPSPRWAQSSTRSISASSPNR